MRAFTLSLLLCGLLYAEGIDEDIAGFDTPSSTTEQSGAVEEALSGFEESEAPTSVATTTTPERTIPFTGKFTQQLALAWHNDAPHDALSSLRSTLLLDYEKKFESGIKLKTNIRAYYDAIYDLRGASDYSRDELEAFRREFEVYDAYLEGKITDNLDFKLGRQVVVWGRSDTIRVTDILNPLDNRRPAMTDIEDLRLPVTMLKLDYFVGQWRITPIAILEQRFSKTPPAGGEFNPAPTTPNDRYYDDVSLALSVGGEFEGWDINFYGANTRSDEGYRVAGNSRLRHDHSPMVGTALNLLSGSWLFKSELAYFDDLQRTDILLGVEYNGIADSLISYDFVKRKEEKTPLETTTYQHALRVSWDSFNATLKSNYLLSLYGKNLDEGGFQRAWVKYDYSDTTNLTLGVVDYIGGSPRFDSVENNDKLFFEVSYSF